jgi:BirA family biotin operon repressor/biotin-[acetyl-CoA-carboxylase] ligase
MVTGVQGSRARSALAGTRFADVRWVGETTSTNDDLQALVLEGTTDDVVLVADHQTAGRGRLGRTWEAPPASSLLVSVLVHVALDPAQAHLVATATACAAAEACERVAGVVPALKWPNDLVIVDGDHIVRGKLAGILAESVVEAGRLEAVVVGVGINVNWPAELPAELDGIAIALNHVVEREVDREDLLVALLERLEVWLAAIEHPAGRAALLRRYRAACSTLGARVRVELSSESFEGTAVAIDDDGHLVVAHDADRRRREVVAGDVVHVRPA